jgi:hypothetical protein
VALLRLTAVLVVDDAQEPDFKRRRLRGGEPIAALKR